jgi:hypothetical protein
MLINEIELFEEISKGMRREGCAVLKERSIYTKI